MGGGRGGGRGGGGVGGGEGGGVGGGEGGGVGGGVGGVRASMCVQVHLITSIRMNCMQASIVLLYR